MVEHVAVSTRDQQHPYVAVAGQIPAAPAPDRRAGEAPVLCIKKEANTFGETQSQEPEAFRDEGKTEP